MALAHLRPGLAARVALLLGAAASAAAQRSGSSRGGGYTIDLTAANWHVTNHGSWLIRLDSRSCAPCKALAPVVERVAQAFNTGSSKHGIIVGVVDVDRQPGAHARRARAARGLARARARSTPTPRRRALAARRGRRAQG